jgi:hypothetical protein
MLTVDELKKQLVEGSEFRTGLGSGEGFYFEKVQAVGSPFNTSFSYERGCELQGDCSTEDFSAMWSFSLPICEFGTYLRELLIDGRTVFSQVKVSEHYWGKKPYQEERTLEREGYVDITLMLNEGGKPVVKAHNPQEIQNLDRLILALQEQS